jgi:hypothetical protein
MLHDGLTAAQLCCSVYRDKRRTCYGCHLLQTYAPPAAAAAAAAAHLVS